MTNDPAIVNLIASHIHPEWTLYGFNALHYATYLDSYQCGLPKSCLPTVTCLLNNGVNPNMIDKDGQTPLMIVASNAYNNNLIGWSCLCNTTSYCITHACYVVDGKTINIYVENNISAMAELLVNGAEETINHIDKWSYTVLMYSVDNMANWNDKQFKNCIKRVQLLLDYGANPNITNIDGDSALHLVIYGTDKKNSYYCAQLVLMLLLDGADPCIRNNNGDTCLDVILRKQSKLSEYADPMYRDIIRIVDLIKHHIEVKLERESSFVILGVMMQQGLPNEVALMIAERITDDLNEEDTTKDYMSQFI